MAPGFPVASQHHRRLKSQEYGAQDKIVCHDSLSSPICKCPKDMWYDETNMKKHTYWSHLQRTTYLLFFYFHFFICLFCQFCDNSVIHLADWRICELINVVWSLFGAARQCWIDRDPSQEGDVGFFSQLLPTTTSQNVAALLSQRKYF